MERSIYQLNVDISLAVTDKYINKLLPALTASINKEIQETLENPEMNSSRLKLFDKSIFPFMFCHPT